MNSKVNATSDDILNEIIGIEYEDDDALTLLDDEEATVSHQETDEDLNSFYADYDESKPLKRVNVDLYSEKEVETSKVEVLKPEPKKVSEPIRQIPVEQVVKEVPTIEKKEEQVKESAYQSKLDKLSTNIDAYLNGSLESRKDTVKVEKMESVVVKAPSIPVERPAVNTPETPKVNRPMPQYKPATDTNDAPTKEETNINQLFAKVSDNVRGASDVKRKMEDRFRELQRLYDEFERKKKAELEEINAYKEEVLNKLKNRKEEIDEQTRKLKLEQDAFDKQKKEFEIEKERLKEEAKKKEQELLASFEEREKNIEQVEKGLIRRKEQLDIEKAAIAKEKTRCELERKELADNLVKFNQLVDDFTNGVDRFSENN